MIVLNLFLFLRYPMSIRCLGSKDTAAVDETDVRVLNSALSFVIPFGFHLKALCNVEKSCD